MHTKYAFVPLLLVSLTVESVPAADHSAIMPFVTDDVVAVAYLDLSTIDTAAVLGELRGLNAVPQDQWDEVAASVKEVQQWIDSLIQNGSINAYILLRVTDIQHRGPTWVLTLSETADSSRLTNLVAEAEIPLPIMPKVYGAVDGALLGAMDQAQLDRLTEIRASDQRREVAEAIEKLGDGDVGLVVFGDSDSRKVLREMFPPLPVPLAEIDGRMIADDLRWGGLIVDLPPELKARIHIETSGAPVAETIQRTAVACLELAKMMALSGLADSSKQVDGVREILGLLKPTVDGTAVTLSIGAQAEELARLRDLLSPPLVAAQEATQRQRRMNQFKQLALAFHNNADRHRAFPEQASHDAEGRPLLSWRVHLLPWLEEKSLYDEFHLDEPWDSPHNRKLIARMPEIYSDPSGLVRRDAGAGRTTFVAPIAPETVFPPHEALPEGKPLWFRDVTDGTSNTIMFVEVVPEHAVVWSEPDDWEVDLEQSTQGVKRTDRAGFVAAFCDGHVRFIANDIAPQQFRAVLTRAGREVVNW